MKNIKKAQIQNLGIYFFLLVILTLLLPSFNLHLLYSHGIAKIGLLVLFIFIPFLNRKNIFSSKYMVYFIPFLLFYLSQGLSVMNSIDTPTFIDRFENLTFAFLVLFITTVYVDTTSTKQAEQLLFVFLVSFLFNFISMLLLYFDPSLYFSFFTNILHPDMLTFVQMNLNRDRIFFLMFDEVYIPFVFLSMLTLLKVPKKYAIPLLLLAAMSIISTSLLSNFRTKILMSFFAILASLLAFNPYLRKSAILIIVIIGGFIVASHAFFTNTIGFSIVDRFLLVSESRDAQTIGSRIEMVREAMKVGNLYPIVGIGLGQYNYYIQPVPQPLTLNTAFYRNKDIYLDARLPHTIFAMTWAETGFFGITAIILMLLYFSITDIHMYRRKIDYMYASFSIAFWTLFIYAVLNPVANFNFWVFFFLFRGVLLRRLFDSNYLILFKDK